MRDSLTSIGLTIITAVLWLATPSLAGMFPVESPWGENRDLKQLERSWFILENPGIRGSLLAPVSFAGPQWTPTQHPESLSPDKGPNAEFGPRFRFDLCSSNHFQGGQANSRFFNELPFTPRELNRADQRMRVSAGFLAHLAPGWTLWQRTIVDSDPLLDPASRTKEFHQIDASVEVPGAVLAYDRRHLSAWVGRRSERWGPGWTGSLILEPGAPNPDGFGYSWTRERWTARYRCARLDDSLHNVPARPRFLAGHRLDVAVTPSFRLGLSETALVASSGAVPFWLLNPLLPWSLSQSEDRTPSEGTNIYWSLDAIWNPTEQWSLYGQFLLDDFMIDVEDRDTYPDQLGGLVGWLWSGHPSHSGPSPHSCWRAGFEYSRIGAWTYVHRDRELRYQAWSMSLGHPAGPDSESFTLFCSRTSLGNGTKTSTGFGSLGLDNVGPSSSNPLAMAWVRFHRQGQIWLNTPLNSVGATGQPSPTKPVSRWWQVGASLRIQPVFHWTANLRTGWTDCRPGIPADNDPRNPASLNASNGFWASITISIPLLSIASNL